MLQNIEYYINITILFSFNSEWHMRFEQFYMKFLESRKTLSDVFN